MNAQLLYAPDFIHLDQDKNVSVDNLMLRHDAFYFTQGFICSDHKGEICNLVQTGSDLTVSLLASTTDSSEVQIWSVDNVMCTADSKIVKGAKPIEVMSYSQAAELAYFGAQILHPLTIQPCRDANIDVVLRNTSDPEFLGTRITTEENKISFLATAHKDNVTLVRITANKVLSAYGFLASVLEVFEQNGTVIDMVTTTEAAIAATVSDTSALPQLVEGLSKLGEVEVEHNNSVVSIVGNMDYDNEGIAAVIFSTVNKTPVKLISYGASQRSISMLVDSKYTKAMLENINTMF